MRPVFRPALFLLALLSLLAGACRTDGIAAKPTSPPIVTAPAPLGPPAPTQRSPTRTAVVRRPTAAPTVAAGSVAWTLTILHTGEVYGEVLPCG